MLCPQDQVRKVEKLRSKKFDLNIILGKSFIKYMIFEVTQDLFGDGFLKQFFFSLKQKMISSLKNMTENSF